MRCTFPRIQYTLKPWYSEQVCQTLFVHYRSVDYPSIKLFSKKHLSQRNPPKGTFPKGTHHKALISKRHPRSDNIWHSSETYLMDEIETKIIPFLSLDNFLEHKSQILDRHLGWRSLDPTLDISSDFVKKKKKHSASFFFYFLSPSLLH